MRLLSSFEIFAKVAKALAGDDALAGIAAGEGPVGDDERTPAERDVQVILFQDAPADVIYSGAYILHSILHGLLPFFFPFSRS